MTNPLPALTPGAWVSLDTETTGGLHPDPPENARCAIVSLAWRDVAVIRSVALPFAFGRGRGEQATLPLYDDPNLSESDWYEMLTWLQDKRLIMHPGKFDLTIMAVGTDQWSGIPLENQLQWDTLLAAHELDPGREAGLEALERDLGYLTPEDRAVWKESKGKRAILNKVGWDEAEWYAKIDAEVTYAIFESQAQRFEEGEGDWYGYNVEVELTRALFHLEQLGIGYDGQESDRIAQSIQKQENQIKKGLPFRPTLHGAKKYYYVTLGMEPAERTPTGQPKLDDSEVARLVAREAPYAREFQRLRKLETARSKWYESYSSMLGWDGRLRTSFSQAKVISGRLSATRVNLQGIPHDYQLAEVMESGYATPRSLFRAKPGARLWELDLSQAELRVAAQEAHCESMLELVRGGEDIHGTVATQLFDDHPGSETWDFHRSIGKRADFAFIFGVGADTFQVDLANLTGIWLSLAECQRIVGRWRRLYPEFGKVIKRYMEQANHWQYVKLVNGRIRHFGTWEEQHKAFNQYVQGSLAELMKAWLIKADQLYPGVCLLTIHDSLVLETSSKAVVSAIRKLGEDLGTEWFKVPMVVDMKEWLPMKEAA